MSRTQLYSRRPMSMDTDAPFWPPLLAKLIRGEELTADEAGGALATILEGRATPAQIAGFAVSLRAKGETPAEMAALVRTMLAASMSIARTRESITLLTFSPV